MLRRGITYTPGIGTLPEAVGVKVLTAEKKGTVKDDLVEVAVELIIEEERVMVTD
jgi:hypothetical protein